MNNTTKAKYDLARKMLKGKIDVEEVAMMTTLPLKEIEKLNEEINPVNPDEEVLKRLDTVDLGPVLYDNTPAEDEELEGFKADYKGEDEEI